MAESKSITTNPANWLLADEFLDADDQPVRCDQTNCKVGSYIVEAAGTGLGYSPACTTCEFAGELGDVFNPDEERYEPGAPEDFKKAAARILTTVAESPIDAIRIGRPDTAAMIDDYATPTQ